jgi:transcriptional regulator GlxA family with amidase domain
MISQQRRDVKYFLKISYKKAQKNPLLLGTMRVLKSLSRPFVSVITGLFVVSKAGLFHI